MIEINKRQQKRRLPERKLSRRQGGFVFILVVVAIVVVGAMMFVLTGLSNTMLFESDTAYLKGCERNLVLSGLGWAKCNIKNRRAEASDRTVELDVAEMSIDGASLSVTTGVPAAGNAEVQVQTRCSHRRRTVRHSEKYVIAL